MTKQFRTTSKFSDQEFAQNYKDYQKVDSIGISYREFVTTDQLSNATLSEIKLISNDGIITSGVAKLKDGSEIPITVQVT